MFNKRTKEEQSTGLEMFVLYDTKSKSYDVPSIAANRDVLMRDIMNDFNVPDRIRNKLYINAEDFSVFKVGYFDKSTGKITTHELEHQFNMHDLRALAKSDQELQIPRGMGARPAQEMGIVPT